LLLWLIEPDVFQLPQLHKHFNVRRNVSPLLMTSDYEIESEQKIGAILLKDGWADKVYWDRNDWYVEWSNKAKPMLFRIPAILKYWYNLNESDLKCVDFMKKYFGLIKGNNTGEELSINMQEAIIGLAQDKLQKPLTDEITFRIRNPKWSYMGLKMIIDSVKQLEGKALEDYLQNLQ
jgi:hypothetical protein